MKCSRTLLLAAAAVLLCRSAAYARISHGFSGILTIDTVTAVNEDPGALPKATILAAIYPNPFNPQAMIEFELADAGAVELAIYDVGGGLVRVLDSGPRSAGRFQVTWDGQDDAGRALPSGTYFCRLKTSLGTQTRKLTLAR